MLSYRKIWNYKHQPSEDKLTFWGDIKLILGSIVAGLIVSSFLIGIIEIISFFVTRG